MVKETLAQRMGAQHMGAQRMEVKTPVLTVEREEYKAKPRRTVRDRRVELSRQES